MINKNVKVQITYKVLHDDEDDKVRIVLTKNETPSLTKRLFISSQQEVSPPRHCLHNYYTNSSYAQIMNELSCYLILLL